MTQTNQKNEMTPDEMDFAMPVDAPLSPSGLSSRKKLIRWGAAGLIVLTLGFGIRYYLHALSHESTDDAFIDGNIVPISPRVAGHVAGVHVRDNQDVKAGDLLVELDPSDFVARLDAATAALEAAKAGDRARNAAVELTTITATAELDEARENVEAAKAAVQKAGGGIELSRAALDQARAEADSDSARHQRDATDLIRYREMEKTRTVSPQDLDHAAAAEQISAAALTAAEKKIDTQKAMVQEAEAVLKVAEANLRQADARLVAARSAPQRIKQSRSQADVSRADIDKAMAEVELARLNLSYTKIYAPSDGFVTKKGVEPGQFVQAGQSLLAIVPRAVWVAANFKETQLTQMLPGQPVEIAVDAYPELTFHGLVDSIQRGTGARFSLLPPENATGNYVKVVQRIPVKIVFDPPDAIAKVLLAPGMSVVAEVNVGAKGKPSGSPEDSSNTSVPPRATKGANATP
jgi:membrane fusion protein (multidrug efflux system)